MRFKILGPLEVSVENQPLDIGGKKPQTLLLALVLANGQTVRTEQLIASIWGENPPSKPEVALRAYVSNLRKALHPERPPATPTRLIITQGGGYALDADSASVDAHEFQELAAQLRTAGANSTPGNIVELADRALALWRTNDLSIGPIRSFPGQSASLTDLRTEVHERRLNALITSGRAHQAITDVRLLIHEDPYREPLREILMLALHTGGRTADALAEFQIARKRLIEDLGLDLGPSIRELESRILSGDQATQLGRRHDDQTTPDTDTQHREPRPPPIGRQDETQGLLELLAHDRSSTQLGVLTGEPGIGKTTLATHVANRAQDMGQTVAWGRCHEGGESDTYRPWTAILRVLLQPLSDQDKRVALGERAVDLEPLLSDADQRTLDLSADAIPDPGAIYDAVTQTLIRISERRPVLLLFEDLHWADVESARLISFAMPALLEHGVSIVATWRTTERTSPKLQAALADVSRAAGPTRFALEGLTSEAVGQLYEQSEGRASSIDLAVELWTRTNGNPLFVTELLRAGSVDASVAAVPTVGEAIDARIGNLPAGSRELLLIGALCPLGFSETLLSSVAGTSIEEALDRIEDAMSARILEESPADHDQFRFTHAVIAERLASTVSTRRRSMLHAKLGDALQESHAPASRLAYHYLLGSSADRGLVAAEFARRAASDCSRLFDHFAAAGLLERGLEVLKALPPNDQTSDEALAVHSDLLTDLAQALKHLQQYERVHSVAQESFQVARKLGDVGRMTAAAMTHTGQTRQQDGTFSQQWLGYWSPPQPAREMLMECLDLLDTSNPLRIGALFSYAANAHDIPHDDAFNAIVAESLTLSRKMGKDHLLAEALIHTIQTTQRSLPIERRQALADEAIVVSERSNLTIRNLTARSIDLVVAMDQRRLREALDQLANIERIGRSSNGPLAKMWSESLAISVATFQGRFAEADERINRALSGYAKYGAASIDMFGLQLSTLYREVGRTDEVIDMMTWKLSGYPGVAFAVPLAALHAETGNGEAARELIDEYGADAMFYGGEAILQFMTPTLYTEVVDVLGDTSAANELYKSLALAENRVVAMTYASILLGSGSLPLGRMATLLGDFDNAERHLTDALEHHRALEAKPYIARTSAALAVLAAARSQEDLCEQHAFEASELADQLGMTWLSEQIPHRVARAIERTR